MKTAYLGDQRWYETPEGLLPGVTTVLAWGDRHNTALAEWRKRVGEEEAERISRESREAGTAMHEAIECRLLGRPEPEKTARVAGLMESIGPFIDRIEPLHLEIPLYSRRIGLAGRCDCIGRIGGRLTVIDFKNSTKPKKVDWIRNYFLQVAAYAGMYTDLFEPVDRGAIAIAVVGHPVQVFEFEVGRYMKPLGDLVFEFYASIAE